MSDFMCPRNLTEVLTASKRLGCSQDIYNNNQYLCLPNVEKTALVELCHKEIMGIIVKGNCLETHEGKVIRSSCLRFKSGCPDTAFNTKDIYKYPACQEINTENRCYLADPLCPNPGISELELSTSIYNTTDSTYPTSTFQEAGKDDIGAVIGGVLAFVLVLVSLLIIGVIWKRRKCQTDVKRERVGELQPLKDEEEQCNTAKPNDNNALETQKPKQLDYKNVSSVNETRTLPKSLEQPFCTKLTESEDFLIRIVGEYSVWKTEVSDSFLTMGCDQLYILFCFLCSESGSPDFTKPEWLEILNEIRHMAHAPLEPINSENAQKTLDYLKRTEPDLFEKGFQNITKDAADETVYRIGKESRLLTFYMSNSHTTRQYLRLSSYIKKPGEKCIINKSSHFDSLLMLRLQMDILFYETIKGTNMANQVFQILNIPEDISTESKNKREEFVRSVKQSGGPIHCRTETHDNFQHVKWLWKCHRPDIIRSCIGLYPHLDNYVINNIAYRRHSTYHDYSPVVRCLLYSLLFAEGYKLKVSDKSYKSIPNKIRERYFAKYAISDDDMLHVNLPNEIAQTKSGEVTFVSADIRHEVMYAFVTECLLEDVDLEFFLKEASCHVLSEYCRSWDYEKKDEERCLYVPNKPVDMCDLFIKRLNLDIVKHCTMSDWSVCNSVTEILKVPLEILKWDKKARERYVEVAKKGTRTVHHSRGMIVGCAGAGKTTLLKRLLKCSPEEILNVTTTEGLEVHEEIFEIFDESLRATDSESRASEGYLNAKRLSVFDFGGQSVYYAWHQIYLTRRAFYVVVVDASQDLNKKVSGTVCRQDGSVFAGWTFGEYFVFWMKSIHTYCAMENKGDEKPTVLIVATHWEEGKRKFENKEVFLNCLGEQLPPSSNLAQYIKKDNCYCIQFPIQPITELERRIASIACQQRWNEKIPKEWAIFGLELNQKKYARRVMEIRKITAIPENDSVHQNDQEDKIRQKQDMLRYYHDAGKILYFDEKGLQNFVIMDVQWFIDAFKIIITDNLNLEGISAVKRDLDEFYVTGHLRDQLLSAIWQHKDKALMEKLDVDKDQSMSISKDVRFIIFHKDLLLQYMQRLGLVAVGKDSHYIPCMNRKEVEKEIPKRILDSENRTSILIYKFDFLPYFFFFRLVVACMQEENWEVLKIKEISCLYKNAALFYSGDYNIVLSVTKESIQLQIFHAECGHSLEVEKTSCIQKTVDDKLKTITKTFHQKVLYEKGVRCKEDEHQTVATEIQGYFLREHQDSKICPLHRFEDKHEINTDELMKYWIL